MFVVFLRFSQDRQNAPKFMAAHKAWIRRGLDDGVFLLAGSLPPNLGGGILAHNTSRPDLEKRLRADPFVEKGVVSFEIVEITPALTDQRLAFLAG